MGRKASPYSRLIPAWFTPFTAVRWLTTEQAQEMVSGRAELERYLKEYPELIQVFAKGSHHKFLSWQVEAAIIQDANKQLTISI